MKRKRKSSSSSSTTSSSSSSSSSTSSSSNSSHEESDEPVYKKSKMTCSIAPRLLHLDTFRYMSKFLDPLSLTHLCQACPAWSIEIFNRKQTFIWEEQAQYLHDQYAHEDAAATTRQDYQTLYNQVKESKQKENYKWLVHLFTVKGCDLCQKPNIRKVYPSYKVRMCEDCLHKNTISEYNLMTKYHVNLSLLTGCRSNVGRLLHRRGSLRWSYLSNPKYYWIQDVDKVLAQEGVLTIAEKQQASENIKLVEVARLKALADQREEKKLLRVKRMCKVWSTLIKLETFQQQVLQAGGVIWTRRQIKQYAKEWLNKKKPRRNYYRYHMNQQVEPEPPVPPQEKVAKWLYYQSSKQHFKHKSKQENAQAIKKDFARMLERKNETLVGLEWESPDSEIEQKQE